MRCSRDVQLGRIPGDDISDHGVPMEVEGVAGEREVWAPDPDKQQKTDQIK